MVKNIEKIITQSAEFQALKGVVENNDWHLNQSTYDHTLLVVKNIKKLFKKFPKSATKLNKKIDHLSLSDLTILAGYLHDIGKKKAFKKEGDQSFFVDHEKHSFDIAKQLLKEHLSEKEIDFLLKLIRNHSFYTLKHEGKPETGNIDYIKENIPEILYGLCFLDYADFLSCNMDVISPWLFDKYDKQYQDLFNTLGI